MSWKLAIERRTGPSCLIFSRQNLAHMSRTPEQLAAIARGGYVLRDCAGTPDAIIIATGSEVELAMKAAEAMSDKAIRVVSMPSTDTFDAQDAAYRESVLPKAVTARVAVEAAVTDGWWKYVGHQGAILGVDRFGESAPAGALFKEFGVTVEDLVAKVRGVL